MRVDRTIVSTFWQKLGQLDSKYILVDFSRCYSSSGLITAFFRIYEELNVRQVCQFFSEMLSCSSYSVSYMLFLFFLRNLSLIPSYLLSWLRMSLSVRISLRSASTSSINLKFSVKKSWKSFSQSWCCQQIKVMMLLLSQSSFDSRFDTFIFSFASIPYPTKFYLSFCRLKPFATANQAKIVSMNLLLESTLTLTLRLDIYEGLPIQGQSILAQSSICQTLASFMSSLRLPSSCSTAVQTSQLSPLNRAIRMCTRKMWFSKKNIIETLQEFLGASLKMQLDQPDSTIICTSTRKIPYKSSKCPQLKPCSYLWPPKATMAIVPKKKHTSARMGIIFKTIRKLRKVLLMKFLNLSKNLNETVNPQYSISLDSLQSLQSRTSWIAPRKFVSRLSEGTIAQKLTIANTIRKKSS